MRRRRRRKRRVRLGRRLYEESMRDAVEGVS
jgi:hypothetical protein